MRDGRVWTLVPPKGMKSVHERSIMVAPEDDIDPMLFTDGIPTEQVAGRGTASAAEVTKVAKLDDSGLAIYANNSVAIAIRATIAWIAILVAHRSSSTTRWTLLKDPLGFEESP
jgi:hypothetical protein